LVEILKDNSKWKECN